MNKTVAVLTPSYNRAYILGKLYESLRAQTCFDFKWYIVDDGSSDDTKAVCAGFSPIEFEIEYISKINGGKHTAINTGLEYITEELIFIVDSDDRLTPDAIEVIVNDWQIYKNRKDIAALSYYKCYTNNTIVGDCYDSKTPFVDSYINIRINKGVKGDKAEVFVAEVLKKFRFPVFENERFLSESVLWMAISKAGYQYAYISKSIYICEYLGDGLTQAGKTKILKNPLGTRAHALSYLSDEIKQILQWKYAILYNTACCLSKITLKKRLNECPKKIKCILSYPLGVGLSVCWRLRWGKNRG